ncbi:hypothetical protein K2D_25040 [Enterococcus hirae]|nr:hypothetical protein K2D_25040 [Enterococcus hirae]
MLHEDERIDQLYANDIKIIQSPHVFSFSLDAVLLAHFARVPKKGQIVDLCAHIFSLSTLTLPPTQILETCLAMTSSQ